MVVWKIFLRGAKLMGVIKGAGRIDVKWGGMVKSFAL